MINVQFNRVPAAAIVQPEHFTLHVPDAQISAWRSLLEHSAIAPQSRENTQAQFGVTRGWIVDAKNAWLNDFDWRRTEERINSHPNFKMTIQDSASGELNIHFVALFSQKIDAVPIMLLHGWPGSFLEFLPMLSLFAKKYSPETLPYHIIVPSLPGYALSSGPPLDRDFTLADGARIMNQLMINLGFSNGYIAQGGDVGSMISRILSESSNECKAIHVNLLNIGFLDSPRNFQPLEANEQEAMLRCDMCR
ncbi:epoxide hydrolase [Fusarium albosuccineum]|uniref:Epoxide hydrolase n=1 Tax=Fusarium albosuccineum TaxID=1237068 RepID=A0A8H4LM05_9HYPO|nr:epoxide hydrolase [Fusarium albosuccineum]